MHANHLHLFWVIFRGAPCVLGYGVTAFDEADARVLLSEQVFPEGLPEIESIRTDIVPAQLDQDHVIPNMGNIFARGIWFPVGYAP